MMVNRNSYSSVTTGWMKTYFPSMAFYVAKFGYLLCDFSCFVYLFPEISVRTHRFSTCIGPQYLIFLAFC
jgi:hypothetical protein